LSILNFDLIGINFYLGSLTVDFLKNKKKFKNWNIDKTIKKTGFNKIHHSKKNQTALDLAEKCCNNFFTKKNLKLKKSIDCLIYVTQSPEYLLPTTACILQKRIGLNNEVLAFDINQGCSGFVNALAVASSMIHSDLISNCMIVCADTYSKYIGKEDKKNYTLFSDASSLFIIKKGKTKKINNFLFGTNGEGYEDLILPNSALKKELNKRNNLHMDGNKILMFTMATIPMQIKLYLKKVNIPIQKIDYFVFHQASKIVIDQLTRNLNIDSKKVIFNSGMIGNTVSSTIPISILKCIKKNKFKKGNKILLAGFGVGLSWAICCIDW
jgi:3-oxoacyl-[acyl-carrier-protein] synthase III